VRLSLLPRSAEHVPRGSGKRVAQALRGAPELADYLQLAQQFSIMYW